MFLEELEHRLMHISGVVLRYSLVLIFVAFGFYKFTPQEAASVPPLMANSPVLFWVERLFGTRGASDFIGVIEIMFGILIALRHFSPRLSFYGSIGTAFALMTTLSFLFTTPGLASDPILAGFLAKDLTLLGAALWSAGEALAAARPHRGIPVESPSLAA